MLGLGKLHVPLQRKARRELCRSSTISQLRGHRLCFQPFVCLNFPIPLPPAACSQPVCWDLPRV